MLMLCIRKFNRTCEGGRKRVVLLCASGEEAGEWGEAKQDNTERVLEGHRVRPQNKKPVRPKEAHGAEEDAGVLQGQGPTGEQD